MSTKLNSLSIFNQVDLRWFLFFYSQGMSDYFQLESNTNLFLFIKNHFFFFYCPNPSIYEGIYKNVIYYSIPSLVKAKDQFWTKKFINEETSYKKIANFISSLEKEQESYKENILKKFQKSPFQMEFMVNDQQ